MGIDGFFTIIAIIISLYTLAQPIQRKTINIFIIKWIIISSLIISLIFIIWRASIPIFNYLFYPWSNFVSLLLTILLPLGSIIFSFYKWHSAKLTIKNDSKFRSFIETSINEKKYDELLRIIKKNDLPTNASLEALRLIFNGDVVKNINTFPLWIHLSLLRNDDFISKLPDKFEFSDVLMRDLVSKDKSILQKYIVKAHGGREYQHYTIYEKELIEDTINNPHWYIDLRADYPLLLYACENIDSGKLDIAYNLNDPLYINFQGESTRIKCPVYIFIQVHSMMLMEVVDKKLYDRDYYETDLFDIFKRICDHTKYDEHVWKLEKIDLNRPTPFSYLMDLILMNLNKIAKKQFDDGNRNYGNIGEIIIKIWLRCLWYLAISINRVNEEFLINNITRFIEFTLKVKDRFSGNNHSNEWCDLIIRELKHYIGISVEFKHIFKESIEKLDSGKSYIFNNKKWLIDKIGNE